LTPNLKELSIKEEEKRGREELLQDNLNKINKNRKLR
jgi:hypothetical protein